MNYQQTMNAVEFADDRELARLDAAESALERMQEYVHARSQEIYDKRMSNLTVLDFILALEIISTLPESIKAIYEATYTQSPDLCHVIRGAVQGALMTNSIEIAVTEANAMEQEPISRERH